jgi:hypothetical protein
LSSTIPNTIILTDDAFLINAVTGQVDFSDGGFLTSLANCVRPSGDISPGYDTHATYLPPASTHDASPHATYLA